ncbi:TetR/AcrR family transcriptional regulator [Streptomyces litmocidini]|uniref:TetR/AcrR family transcriptional regulator n=1 Tax=Streptomyces litmocidini TaxID=67318 RepID=UPI0036F60745
MSFPDSSVPDPSAHSQRKHQARGERRIAQILGAAEDLIADMGVQAVSMNAIARRAGISPGSLYQYFPGKDAVVEEMSRRLVVQLQHAKRRVSWTSSQPVQPTPETVIDLLLEAVMFLAQEHPALPALLVSTEPTEPNALLKAIARSLPRPGAVHDEDVTRDLAALIFCTGLGLAVRHPDPAVLLRPTRQAVLSALRPTEDPQPSACPPPTSQTETSAPAAR